MLVQLNYSFLFSMFMLFHVGFILIYYYLLHTISGPQLTARACVNRHSEFIHLLYWNKLVKKMGQP